MCLHQRMFTSLVNPHFLLALKRSSVHDWLSFFRVKITQTVSNSEQNHISSAHLGPNGNAQKWFNGPPVWHQLIDTKMLLLITCDGVTLMKPTACNALCAESTALQAVSAPVWFLQKAPFPLFWCSVVFPSELLYRSQFQTFPSELIRWGVVGGIQADSINILSPRLKQHFSSKSLIFIPFILSIVSVHC